MEIGKKYQEVEIIDYSHEGLGISRVDDWVIFVPYVLKGELIDLEITDLKKRHGFGVATEIKQKSSERVEPRCQHYFECGGCNLQHMTYEEQLKLKLNAVNNTLKKSGIDYQVETIIANKGPWEYRNKMVFKFDQSPTTGTKYIGMNQEKSHYAFHIKHCDLQDQEMNNIVLDIDKIMKQSKETICTVANPKGNLKQLVLKKTSTNQILVTIVSRNGKFIDMKELLSTLTEKYPNIKSIQINKSEKLKKEHLGYPSILLYGEKFITEEVNGLDFQVQTNSFFQVNTPQAELLYQKVIETTDFKGKKVLDAYCGTGTIALGIANVAQSVFGVDNNDKAISDAKKNSKINGIKNVKFKCSPVETEIEKFKNSNYDVVVVDPPRKGLTNAFVNFLIDLKVPELIYVSCAPSTLARDLKALTEQYKVESIECVDMFSQTFHIETVVKLKLK